MQVTREQRLNNIGMELVTKMRNNCEEFQTFLDKGIDLPAGNPRPGLPPFKCNGDEVKASLGDNLKPFQTVLDFVLKGKSNKISASNEAEAPKTETKGKTEGKRKGKVT